MRRAEVGLRHLKVLRAYEALIKFLAIPCLLTLFDQLERQNDVYSRCLASIADAPLWDIGWGLTEMCLSCSSMFH